MVITLYVPTETVRHISSGRNRVAAVVRESVLVGLYREGTSSDSEFRRALKIDRFELDEILPAHGVMLEMTADEVLSAAARPSAARSTGPVKQFAPDHMQSARPPLKGKRS